MKWGSTLNLLLGVWLLFSPWALHLTGAAISNYVIFGIIAIVVASCSLVVADHNHVPAWINLVVGIWTFISPWVLGYAGNGVALWNGIAVGILMIVFAAARMTGTRLPARPVA